MTNKKILDEADKILDNIKHEQLLNNKEQTQDKQLNEAAEKELDKRILYFPESEEMKHEDIKRNVVAASVKAIKSDTAKQYWYEQFKELNELKSKTIGLCHEALELNKNIGNYGTPQQPISIEAISAMADDFCERHFTEKGKLVWSAFISGAKEILSALGYSAGDNK